MKRKIFSILIDIVLITLVLALADTLALKVFRSESIWLYIGSYIAAYGVVFGAKRGIITLWKRRKIHAPACKDDH